MKTKVLAAGKNAAAQAADSVITLHRDQLEMVSHFKYLGSIFIFDCTLDAEITHRVAAAIVPSSNSDKLLFTNGSVPVHNLSLV